MRILLVGITQQQDARIRDRLRRELSPHVIMTLTSDRTKNVRAGAVTRLADRADEVIVNRHFTRHKVSENIRGRFHHVDGGITAVLAKIKQLVKAP